ncbi:hypothetical protein UlMin_019857 [Ulmus minor]
MEMAKNYVNQDGDTQCPCKTCLNDSWYQPNIVELHILMMGFQSTYQTWIHHGESYQHDDSKDETDTESEEDIDEMVHALYDAGLVNNDDTSMSEQDVKKENDLLTEVEQELYPGCKKFSSLTFLVKLMHIKVLNKWTNKSFDMLLQLLNDAFPKDTRLPLSHYEAKKKLCELGLGYESIHVCKYDCAIFWNENKNLNRCPVCNESRYVVKGKKNVPHKVLRYFPLKPRL